MRPVMGFSWKERHLRTERKKPPRHGEVSAPGKETHLHVVAEVARRRVEPAKGHALPAGPVAESFEHPDEVGAHPLGVMPRMVQKTVTGVFAVWDSCTSRRAFSISELCQAPSPAPAVYGQ